MNKEDLRKAIEAFFTRKNKRIEKISKEYGVSLPPFTTESMEQSPDQSLIKTIRHFQNIKDNF